MPDTAEAFKRFKCIGIVEAGNMGSMMAFAFSELALNVSIWDLKTENVDNVTERTKRAPAMKGKIQGFHCKHHTSQAELTQRDILRPNTL